MYAHVFLFDVPSSLSHNLIWVIVIPQADHCNFFFLSWCPPCFWSASLYSHIWCTQCVYCVDLIMLLCDLQYFCSFPFLCVLYSESQAFLFVPRWALCDTALPAVSGPVPPAAGVCWSFLAPRPCRASFCLSFVLIVLDWQTFFRTHPCCLL